MMLQLTGIKYIVVISIFCSNTFLCELFIETYFISSSR